MKMHHGLGRVVLICAALLSSWQALAQFSQQGPKLVATDAVGSVYQGSPWYLSADGNRTLAGGHTDNGGVGTAWVGTRSGDIWSH